MDDAQKRLALVVGASGIAGQAVSRRLLEEGWHVVGLTRSQSVVEGAKAIHADLLEPATLRAQLEGLDPEVVIFTAWIRKDSEAENIEVNSAILRNFLDALPRPAGRRHVALMTGLKHYLGPFDDYARAVSADTPFREESGRLDVPNFYYAQEDVLFEAAETQGFTWSVHRAHTVFGFAVGNAMNMVLTLGTYAEICRETGQPFVFPGSETQWNGVTDATDADLLADHLIWASTSPEGSNEAFNVANGEVFRWRWLWPRLAEFFKLPWEGFVDAPRPLVGRMDDSPEVWRRIAEREGLVEPDVNRLASWWHSDSDLGRPLECFTDMSKSRLHGFHGYKTAERSFTSAIEQYRAARILPTS
ncbi:SDR family oxidoreductase [Tessaracoccus sp. MC1756]|uniref:SDR family oxidoreductase n=1 Tax=Tessaracoccus sp. MC1756 TaxID=2760311 RepID=UPI0016044BFA|nr:SDR family oxidoreductase [Tessaracoccus sp. MC1756]MBB1510939.1 SDR family oxidoreductase [Tessaracoccus sp. MC1756]